jgi:hypothetical protein
MNEQLFLVSMLKTALENAEIEAQNRSLLESRHKVERQKFEQRQEQYEKAHNSISYFNSKILSILHELVEQMAKNKKSRRSVIDKIVRDGMSEAIRTVNLQGTELYNLRTYKELK